MDDKRCRSRDLLTLARDARHYAALAEVGGASHSKILPIRCLREAPAPRQLPRRAAHSLV